MRGIRVVALIFCVLAFSGTCQLVLPSENPHLTVQWNVPITDPRGSVLHWYEMKADPEDGNNLIVCGAEWNAEDNAYYGVVYSSADGGKTWAIALEDRGSTWVSEQSCAFGERHTAYLISGSSKVIDGRTHHDLGTTHVFVSSNAGRSWVETARAGWADYSNSTFGKPPGSTAGHLYVVYQGLPKRDVAKNRFSTLDFFEVSKDGKSVTEPHPIAGTEERNYQGIYPTSSVTLDDGTPIALFDASLDSGPAKGLMRFEIGAVRFGPAGPSKPVIIATHAARYDAPLCPATLSNSFAYDRARGRLYVAYNDATPGRCAIMVTFSQDGGWTWSVPQELSISGAAPLSQYFPSMAVNEAGVLGFLWRGKPEKSPDCWYFSISREELKVDDTVSLSPCMTEDTLKDQSSGYLATAIKQSETSDPASVQVVTFRDRLLRVGITATAGGAFHPLWSTSGEGNGELRTARIQVNAGSQKVLSRHFGTPELAEITDRIVVLYGGDERLDRGMNSVLLGLVFRNDSLVAIPAPLYLKVEETYSDFGKIDFVNPAPLSLGPEFVDLSSSLHGRFLASHETTAVYHLTFILTLGTNVPKRKNTIVGMKLRFFCRETGDDAAGQR